MKLESKHVLPYVLHGAKMLTEKNLLDSKERIWTLQPSNFPNNWKNEFSSKIILRPLSDLTKEITHNGQTFVPKFVIDVAFPAERMGLNTATWSHRVITKLCEWHFDFQDLIGQGLAIDINTLN